MPSIDPSPYFELDILYSLIFTKSLYKIKFWLGILTNIKNFLLEFFSENSEYIDLKSLIIFYFK